MIAKFLTAAACAVLANSAAPASAATMPDGDYLCSMAGAGNMGTIRIAGATFAGPAYDGDFGPAASYDVDDRGVVTWGGPLAGLDSGGNKVASTIFVPANGGTPPIIEIIVQSGPDDFHTLSCGRE